MKEQSKKFKNRLNYAFVLSIITIVYNTIEGVVSTLFGANDETLVLFGFGLDSFVEVMSGLGIAHMIHRMRSKEINERDKFEITALKLPALPFISLSPDSWQEQGLLYLIRLNFELL